MTCMKHDLYGKKASHEGTVILLMRGFTRVTDLWMGSPDSTPTSKSGPIINAIIGETQP